MELGTDSAPRVFDVPVPDKYRRAWTLNLINHLLTLEDKLSSVSGLGIRIKARIEMLSAEEGAGHFSIWGSYRPNHNFGDAENRNMDIGFIELGEKRLSPGDNLETELTIWSRPGLEDVLQPGRKWRIQAGRRLVGFGTVIAVLGPA